MMRKIWIAFCLAAACFTMWLGFYAHPVPLSAEPRRFVLLLDNDTGLFLSQVRQGIRTGADEMGDQVIIENVSYGGAREALIGHMENGAISGVVLMFREKLNAFSAREAAKALHIPAVSISMNESEEYSVWNDERGAGEQLAKEALAMGLSDRIILCGRDANARERLGGVMDALGEKAPRVVDFSPDIQDLGAIGENTCIIALSAEAATWAAERKEFGALPESVPIIGMNTENPVEDIESERVRAMLFPHPYALGYVAIMNLGRLARGEPVEERTLLPYRLIDKKTIYDAENVKLAFPLLG